MALPKKLKNFDLFQNGESWMGQVASVTLPKLARKMEDWRGGGMDGTVKLDFGADAMEMAFAAGGHLVSALRQYGATSIGAVQLRFAGAYQSDSSGAYDAVEIVTRGRYSEIDRGDGKTGESGEHKYTYQVSYYKESINGETVIEIDVLNNVFIVNGFDVLAAQRAAMGHW
jgi:P2 family phage contractile tail tube protein